MYHLGGCGVFLHGSRQPDAGGPLAGGVDGPGGDVRNVLQQLTLGHSRIPCSPPQNNGSMCPLPHKKVCLSQAAKTA